MPAARGGARWTVFDTSVYVAALREGLGGASFGWLAEAGPRTFLASGVSAELRAGALDEAGRKVVIDLVTRFERLGRVVVPTAGSWNDAGDILARIARREPALRTKLRTLWVVTENLQDFRLLRRYVRFDLEAAPGARD